MLMPFYVWFGLLGLILGGGAMWFIMARYPFQSPEAPPGPVDDAEAPFLAQKLTEDGHPIDEQTVAEVLRAHSDYVGYRIADELANAEIARREAREELRRIREASPPRPRAGRPRQGPGGGTRPA